MQRPSVMPCPGRLQKRQTPLGGKIADKGIERCRRMSNKHLLGVLLLNRVLCLTDLDRPDEAMDEVARLSDLLDALEFEDAAGLFPQTSAV